MSKKIDINSLKNIAFYLEGIKQGQGNLAPLGTASLEQLWNAIIFLQRYENFVKELPYLIEDIEVEFPMQESTDLKKSVGKREGAKWMLEKINELRDAYNL